MVPSQTPAPAGAGFPAPALWTRLGPGIRHGTRWVLARGAWAGAIPGCASRALPL